MTWRFHSTIALASFVLPMAAWAAPAADAGRIYVRTDCEESFNAGAEELTNDNCVETMAEVNDWLKDVRALPPNVLEDWAPVLIDVGAGEFGPFTCGPRAVGAFEFPQNLVTLRGSGPDVTTLRSTALGGGAISLLNCRDINIEHVTAIAEGVNSAGIVWSGPGRSNYLDIVAIGGQSSWVEWDALADPTGCAAGPKSEHFAYDSTFVGNGGYSWFASCSRSWLYGSEVRSATWPMQLFGTGDVRVFGGVIRAIAPVGWSGHVVAVELGFGGAVDGGIFHMHGGIINVDSTAIPGVDAIGIRANDANSFAHTLGTAFVVKAAGTGQAIRTSGIGDVNAPLLLAPSDDPPDNGSGTGSYASLQGQDLFVETDCDPTGDCDIGSDADAHLMVYSAACGADPWLDTVTGRCRNNLDDPHDDLQGQIDVLQALIDDHETRITVLENP